MLLINDMTQVTEQIRAELTEQIRAELTAALDNYGNSVDDYFRLKNKIDEENNKLKEIRDALIKRHGLTKKDINGYKYSCYERKNQRFDKQSFEHDHPELYDQYIKVGTPSIVLSVSKK